MNLSITRRLALFLCILPLFANYAFSVTCMRALDRVGVLSVADGVLRADPLFTHTPTGSEFRIPDSTFSLLSNLTAHYRWLRARPNMNLFRDEAIFLQPAVEAFLRFKQSIYERNDILAHIAQLRQDSVVGSEDMITAQRHELDGVINQRARQNIKDLHLELQELRPYLDATMMVYARLNLEERQKLSYAQNLLGAWSFNHRDIIDVMKNPPPFVSEAYALVRSFERTVVAIAKVNDITDAELQKSQEVFAIFTDLLAGYDALKHKEAFVQQRNNEDEAAFENLKLELATLYDAKTANRKRLLELGFLAERAKWLRGRLYNKSRIDEFQTLEPLIQLETEIAELADYKLDQDCRISALFTACDAPAGFLALEEAKQMLEDLNRDQVLSAALFQLELQRRNDDAMMLTLPTNIRRQLDEVLLHLDIWHERYPNLKEREYEELVRRNRSLERLENAVLAFERFKTAVRQELPKDDSALKRAQEQMERMRYRLYASLLPLDEATLNEKVVLSLIPKTGGLNSGVLAKALAIGYSNYAKAQGWQVTLSGSELAPNLVVEGVGAYHFFYAEAGIHEFETVNLGSQRQAGNKDKNQIFTARLDVVLRPPTGHAEKPLTNVRLYRNDVQGTYDRRIQSLDVRNRMPMQTFLSVEGMADAYTRYLAAEAVDSMD